MRQKKNVKINNFLSFLTHQMESNQFHLLFCECCNFLPSLTQFVTFFLITILRTIAIANWIFNILENSRHKKREKNIAHVTSHHWLRKLRCNLGKLFFFLIFFFHQNNEHFQWKIILQRIDKSFAWKKKKNSSCITKRYNFLWKRSFFQQIYGNV